MSLRVCRHCRKPVSLDARACPHCRRKLMNPLHFKITLAVMAGLLLIAFGVLGYAFWLYISAKHALCVANPAFC